MKKWMITGPGNLVNDRQLEKKPYRETVGSLPYLATIRRPDISYVVNYLSRFNSKSMVSHWKMVKRVF